MPARFLDAEPQLFTADMARARDFYIDRLGFKSVFMYGEPPFYGQVERDGAKLNLRLICEDVFVGDVRQREHLLAAAITVDDVAALDAEFHARAVPLHQALRREPWGARSLVVRDPDGNLVLFAGK